MKGHVPMMMTATVIAIKGNPVRSGATGYILMITRSTILRCIHRPWIDGSHGDDIIQYHSCTISVHHRWMVLWFVQTTFRMAFLQNLIQKVHHIKIHHGRRRTILSGIVNVVVRRIVIFDRKWWNQCTKSWYHRWWNCWWCTWRMCNIQLVRSIRNNFVGNWGHALIGWW